MEKHITIGTKIYCRMEDLERVGTVTELIENCLGCFFSVKLEDGREIVYIPLRILEDYDSGNCSTKFCTLKAHEEWKERLIEEMWWNA